MTSKQPQPDWTLRIEHELEQIEWIFRTKQDTAIFNETYNLLRIRLLSLVRDVQQTTEEQINGQ